MITATLKNVRDTYTAEGASAFEAIANLQVKNLRGKSILTVGGKEIVLTPIQSARLSGPSPAVREVALKNITLRFS